MLEYILLIIIVAIGIRLVYSNDPFLPSSVFFYSIVVTALVFFVATYLRLYPERLATWWLIKRNYKVVGISVLLYYAVIGGVCLLLAKLSRQHKRYSLASKMVNVDLIKHVIRNIMNSAWFLAFVMFWNFAILAHAMDVDFYKLTHYKVYLEARTPAEVGITSTFTSIVHVILPVMGVLFAVIWVEYYRNKKYFLFVLSFIDFLYCLYIAINFDSRFGIVQLAVAGVVLVFTETEGKSWLGYFFISLSFVLYVPLMTLRNLMSERVGEFGVMAFFNPKVVAAIFTWKNIGDKIFFVFFNFFGGGFNFAEAILHSPVHYPWKYVMLSASPLISLIDGFDKVEGIRDVYRASATSPYGSFSEAFLFGWLYFILFMGFIFYFLSFANKYWAKFNRGRAIIIFIPAYFSLLEMHLYGIRHTMRIIYFTMVFILLVEFLRKQYIKRIAKRMRNETVA